MKKFYLLILSLTLTCAAFAQPKAKYVFYFIGDGMGVNQVNGAETYLAALEGRIGVKSLCFTQFPYAAFVTTYSATNGVTDSAAGGTALATGHKTKNGAISVLKDLQTPVYSVAEAAQRGGAAVGISTSVTVDHATPAVFYAHAEHRKMYYEIGKQLTTSNFDFFGGSDFHSPANKEKNNSEPDLYQQAKNNGYTIARGYADFTQKAAKAKKMILFQPETDSKAFRYSIPYKLDRKSGNLSLEQITQAGISFLTKQKKDGFFFMVEGGMIDWACHGNDAASYVNELIDMDKCVQIAYEFYKQHPDSTLIVISADHETGGLSLGRGPYELHLDRLAYQKTSLAEYTRHLKALHQALKENFTWEVVKEDLQTNFGFWDKIELTEQQTTRLKKAYDDLMTGVAAGKEDMYSKKDPITYAAGLTMDEVSLIGWQSGGHSNGFVDAYAIGVGAEAFQGQIDNTEIPRLIAKAAGWQLRP
ncbi:alkaline phosphatase [Alloprevotella tannerae]|uniref:alkaline phosphatase n=1 Tax=Alloprevotella tannerae TaxID=76122 RepID=UPI0028D74F39|nr:alkaline phosphatase [Alloprevotella tannerae]